MGWIIALLLGLAAVYSCHSFTRQQINQFVDKAIRKINKTAKSSWKYSLLLLRGRHVENIPQEVLTELQKKINQGYTTIGSQIIFDETSQEKLYQEYFATKDVSSEIIEATNNGTEPIVLSLN